MNPHANAGDVAAFAPRRSGGKNRAKSKPGSERLVAWNASGVLVELWIRFIYYRLCDWREIRRVRDRAVDASATRSRINDFGGVPSRKVPFTWLDAASAVKRCATTRAVRMSWRMVTRWATASSTPSIRSAAVILASPRCTRRPGWRRWRTAKSKRGDCLMNARVAGIARSEVQRGRGRVLRSRPRAYRGRF